TGYKWRERFLRQGLEGMGEESRRPRSSPKQLSESQVCEMVKLKLMRRYWGPGKIRTLCHRCQGQAPSESSFKRILEQVGLTQPRRVREGPRGGGRLSSDGRSLELWREEFNCERPHEALGRVVQPSSTATQPEPMAELKCN